MNNAPIGIFDSGVGGLTIWQALVDVLDQESVVYYSDTAYAPYGNLSKQDIVERSIKATEFLIKKGCKLVLVACNTATTNAIAELRKRYGLPFVGIEPAIKPAALMTTTKKVGVLATKGTLYSEMFHKTVTDYTSGIDLITQEGKGLVEAIESKQDQTKHLEELLKSYLLPMIDKGIDTLVLGCTHYPYLIPQIDAICNHKLRIIEASEPVANQVKKRLMALELLSDSPIQTQEFYTTADLDLLKRFVLKKYWDSTYLLS